MDPQRTSAMKDIAKLANQYKIMKIMSMSILKSFKLRKA